MESKLVIGKMYAERNISREVMEQKRYNTKDKISLLYQCVKL